MRTFRTPAHLGVPQPAGAAQQRGETCAGAPGGGVAGALWRPAGAGSHRRWRGAGSVRIQRLDAFGAGDAQSARTRRDDRGTDAAAARRGRRRYAGAHRMAAGTGGGPQARRRLTAAQGAVLRPSKVSSVGNSPLRTANSVTAAVLCSSSLRMRFARCFSTVLTLRRSPTATRLLDSPSAMRVRTSRSRSVILGVASVAG